MELLLVLREMNRFILFHIKDENLNNSQTPTFDRSTLAFKMNFFFCMVKFGKKLIYIMI